MCQPTGTLQHRFNNVLRELEQKKPQLDELVHTAENLKADSNRQQLHGKVTKLREHWDETNSKVTQRKTQLDTMLADSQNYESKRIEVETWLQRMETRLEIIAPVGHTADVLEAQIREQKSIHAEVHQYKQHIDTFNQLTQKLIAIYQQDDTTKIKKRTELVNSRYNQLNANIINRGKQIHSAMNSLHNFDRSLDKFLAWLSEAESSLETVDSDMGLPGRKEQPVQKPNNQLRSSRHMQNDEERWPSQQNAIPAAPRLALPDALMGEPTAAAGHSRRRRKLPDLASSIYRHVGSKLGGAGVDAGTSEQPPHPEESGTWRERWFAKWALGRSLSQNSLRLPRHLFRRRSKRKTRREAAEEANYSTDTDDGGFKMGVRSQRNGAVASAVGSCSAGSIECAGRRCGAMVVGAATNGGFGGKERPRSIATLPVRRPADDIIVYYDDDDNRFTKSDSSLLSNDLGKDAGCLLRTRSDEHQRIASKKKKKPLASSSNPNSLHRHSSSSGQSIYEPAYQLRNAGRQCQLTSSPLFDQCHSVDSLPVACRHSVDALASSALFATSSTTLCTPGTTFSDRLGGYLSASCPGPATYCLHDERTDAGASKRPSLVAYQPQVVSTPTVASGRQLSTNPSRRPTDFPAPLVRDDASAKAATNRTPSPLVTDYAFWLSYEMLSERQNGRHGASGSGSRTSRNRLSLPLFSRSHSKSRRYSSRSSSMSSVHNLLTPSALPTKAASLALQQLLACYRNGDMTPEKVSLLLDILDTQERFAKPSIENAGGIPLKGRPAQSR
ncbi:hypothetical protein V9T40_007061 [Parthenolecanium corni]|uniref:Dystrophin n=1 Tax=Parthenolecanium corni TaxID=536013 RepID=A0AAN9TVS5_9HEMI